MSKNTLNIIVLATILFIGIYIGVFIGRYTAGNIQNVPSRTHENDTIPHSAAQIDLNHATLDELMEIPGIGKNIAREIIAYRTEYGDYLEVEELLDVDGMTDELYHQISHYFTVGENQ